MTVDAEYVVLISVIVFFDLIATFGVMWLFARWLTKNTRPKHGHCPPACMCRQPDYIWPKRRHTDYAPHNRRASDAH
jgi:hypothetical protein